MLNKFLGCMLSAALGDSLGASFHRPMKNVLSYTDDTAMMIALAEAVLECGGELDPRRLAWKFVEAYEREPWRGYGPGPPRIFRLIRLGEGPLELDKRLYPGGSLGNGGAMRVAPIGLLYHDDHNMLRKAVEISCKPTHNHPLGIEGALIEAAAVALAVELELESRIDPDHFIERLLSFASSEVYERKLKLIPELLEIDASRMLVAKKLGRSVEAYNSVPTAVYCYLRCQDPLAAIRYAISLGGDRDTIACMAGAIAGAHRGVEPIPEEYLTRLEGREKIKELAEKLYRLKSRLRG
ncbi:MAG: ADP-ribosylglycohydrolase family protein [Thaumarchaeota archaeon]|nr:ADP-ribosylglycohydrolase family protein [Nitrososphaerota archaeon]